MVEELLQVLCPFLAPQPGMPHIHLTFAGHSLGGALAAVLCCLVRMRLHVPASKLHSFSFGSPPVLSLASGSTASDILQVCMQNLKCDVRLLLQMHAPTTNAALKIISFLPLSGGTDLQAPLHY